MFRLLNPSSHHISFPHSPTKTPTTQKPYIKGHPPHTNTLYSTTTFQVTITHHFFRMHSFTALLALAALAHAAPVAQKDAPENYLKGYLEPYMTCKSTRRVLFTRHHADI